MAGGEDSQTDGEQTDTGTRELVGRGWHLWAVGRIGSAVYHSIRYLNPSVVFSLLCRLLGLMQVFASLTPLGGRRRDRLVAWLRTALGGCPELTEVSAVWRDGSLLCRLVSSAVPGACTASHCCLAHGQTIAWDLLHVPPAFSEQDLEQARFTSYLERRLVSYMWKVKESIERVKSSGRPPGRPMGHAPREPQQHVTADCVVKGMGLVAAVQGRRATFYVYLRNPRRSCDLHVEIHGPCGDSGCATVALRTGAMQMCSSSAGGSPSSRAAISVRYRVASNHVRVSYVPRSPGHHELCVTQDGLHAVGSPYNVHVERCDVDGGLTPWKSSSEDEDDERKVVRRRLRVLLRVVDFIGEKMLLTEDGKLRKVCSIEALYSATRSVTSISPSPENNSITNIDGSPIDGVTSQTNPSEPLAVDTTRTKNEGRLRGVELFRDRCRYVICLCNFVLRNTTRQKSLEILQMAEKILDGRPVKLHDDSLDKIKFMVEQIVTSPVYLRSRRPSCDECSELKNENHLKNVCIENYIRGCDSEVNCGCLSSSLPQQVEIKNDSNKIATLNKDMLTVVQHDCKSVACNTRQSTNEKVPFSKEHVNKLDDKKNYENSFTFVARLVPTILEEDEELLYNVKDEDFHQQKYEDIRTVAIVYCGDSNQDISETNGTFSRYVETSDYEHQNPVNAKIVNVDSEYGDNLLKREEGYPLSKPPITEQLACEDFATCNLEQSLGVVQTGTTSKPCVCDTDSSSSNINTYTTKNSMLHENIVVDSGSSDKLLHCSTETKNTNKFHSAFCSTGCTNPYLNDTKRSANTREVNEDLNDNIQKCRLHTGIAATTGNYQEINFNFWQPKPEVKLGIPLQDIASAAVDFEPILSAPSLDEALKKLEQGLQKLRLSPVNMQDTNIGSIRSPVDSNNAPDDICVANHDLDELYGDISAAGFDDSPNNFNFREGDDMNNTPDDAPAAMHHMAEPYGDVAGAGVEDSPVNFEDGDGYGDDASYVAGDSDYVSLDDVRGSLQQSSEDESRSVSSSHRRYRYGEGGRDDARMGPAEREIWGLGNTTEDKGPGRDSSYASRRPQTAMPSSRQYSRFFPDIMQMSSISEEMEDSSSRYRRSDALFSAASQTPVTCENQVNTTGVHDETEQSDMRLLENEFIHHHSKMNEEITEKRGVSDITDNVDSVYGEKWSRLSDWLPKNRSKQHITDTQEHSIQEFSKESIALDEHLLETACSQKTMYTAELCHPKIEKSEIVPTVGQDNELSKESEILARLSCSVSEEQKLKQRAKSEFKEECTVYFLHEENNYFSRKLNHSIVLPSKYEISCAQNNETYKNSSRVDNKTYSTLKFLEIMPGINEPSKVNSYTNEDVLISDLDSENTTKSTELPKNVMCKEDIQKPLFTEKLSFPDGYQSAEQTSYTKLLSSYKKVEPLSPKIKRLGKSLQETLTEKRRSKKHPSILIPGIVSKWRRLFESRMQNENLFQGKNEQKQNNLENIPGIDSSKKTSVSHWKMFWEELLEQRNSESSSVGFRLKEDICSSLTFRNSDTEVKTKLDSVREKHKNSAQSFFRSCIDDSTEETKLSVNSFPKNLQNQVFNRKVEQPGMQHSVTENSLQQGWKHKSFSQHTSFLGSSDCLPETSRDSFNTPRHEQVDTRGHQVSQDDCSKRLAGGGRHCNDTTGKNVTGLVLYSSRDRPQSPTLEHREETKKRFLSAKSFFQTLESSTSQRKHSLETSCGSMWEVSQGELWRRPRHKSRRQPRRRADPGTTATSDSEVTLGRTGSSSESEVGGSERVKKKVAERFHVEDLFKDVHYGAIPSMDGSSTRSLKGVPRHEAVLAALRSVDDDHSSSRASSPYEALQDEDIEDEIIFSGNRGSPIPRYQPQYPHLPETPHHRYRHRPGLLASGFIPRSQLLNDSFMSP